MKVLRYLRNIILAFIIGMSTPVLIWVAAFVALRDLRREARSDAELVTAKTT